MKLGFIQLLDHHWKGNLVRSCPFTWRLYFRKVLVVHHFECNNTKELSLVTWYRSRRFDYVPIVFFKRSCRASPYKARFYAVIDWFSTALIGTFRSSQFWRVIPRGSPVGWLSIYDWKEASNLFLLIRFVSLQKKRLLFAEPMCPTHPSRFRRVLVFMPLFPNSFYLNWGLVVFLVTSDVDGSNLCVLSSSAVEDWITVNYVKVLSVTTHCSFKKGMSMIIERI